MSEEEEIFIRKQVTSAAAFIKKSGLCFLDMDQEMCKKLHPPNVGKGSWKNICPV